MASVHGAIFLVYWMTLGEGMTMKVNRRQVMASAAAVGLLISALGGAALAGTEAEAKAMVAKAIALYDEKGEAAFKIFKEGKA